MTLKVKVKQLKLARIWYTVRTVLHIFPTKIHMTLSQGQGHPRSHITRLLIQDIGSTKVLIGTFYKETWSLLVMQLPVLVTFHKGQSDLDLDDM